MSGRRFERLERERAQQEASPSSRSAVKTRFGGAPALETDAAPSRSGAETARFEEPASKERIRMLDIDAGQPFVRCACCRADNYVNASRCTHCEADLTTPEQRCFNEALWKQHVADREEEQRQLGALRERRDQAEREQAEAVRRQREQGPALEEEDDPSDPTWGGARSFGRFLGLALVRFLPNRSVRLAVIGALGLALVYLLVVFPNLLWAGVFVVFLLGRLALARGRL